MPSPSRCLEGRVVFDLGDDLAILVLSTRCLMQQGVRADQHENRFEIAPKPYSYRRYKFGQSLSEWDYHPTWACGQPCLQRVPLRQIDFNAIIFLRKRAKYC